MTTIVLFIALFIMFALFAVIYVCYRANRDAGQRQQAAQQAVADMSQHAAGAVIITLGPGGSTNLAFVARPAAAHHHHHRPVLTPGGPYYSSATSGKRPCPQRIVHNLPTITWERRGGGGGGCSGTPPQPGAAAAAAAPGAAAAAAESDSEELCVICCCAYEAGETLKLLPCMHLYHAECIDAWLARSHVCPVCQADVIQAAGLSAASEWSVHTLDAINALSGAAGRPASAGGAPAAGDLQLAPVTPQPAQQAPAPTPQQQQPPALAPAGNSSGSTQIVLQQAGCGTTRAAALEPGSAAR